MQTLNTTCPECGHAGGLQRADNTWRTQPIGVVTTQIAGEADQLEVRSLGDWSDGDRETGYLECRECSAEWADEDEFLAAVKKSIKS